MQFEIDNQTLNDLAIFSNGSNNKSIYHLFDKAITIGGREKFRTIFNNPLVNAAEIQDRVDVLAYFQRVDADFKVDKATCDFIEFYMSHHQKSRPFPKVLGALQHVSNWFYKDSERYTIQQGVVNVLKLLDVLNDFATVTKTDSLPLALREIHLSITEILNSKDFETVSQLQEKQKLSSTDLVKADYLFRNLQYDGVKTLLDIVYQLDVFISVAKQGKLLGFNLPAINIGVEKVLRIEGLFHPFVDKPVCNDIEFDSNQNICFVTGTNMAGKSTLLKSIGVSVYLSQLGFPVPAAYMETSTFRGLITTINLSDDIQSGHSHFYSEVLRVKHVAQKLSGSPDMFVIFDELFRGTNVKDAYDASLLIISAFAKLKNPFFVISTHIVEVAKDLAHTPNIKFKFMETSFNNEAPKHSHKLKDGITDERLGLWIVKNEGIVELINKAVG